MGTRVAGPQLSRVLALAPVSAGALLWRAGRELQVTVILQARLGLTPDAEARLLEPAPLVLRDRHHGDDPSRSLDEVSEAVPYRPRVDVWMRGHAVPLGGGRAVSSRVRLAVHRAGAAGLDKQVEVTGDRGGSEGEVMPFARMPLVHERAYGGPQFEANPVGTGARPGSPWPNLRGLGRAEAAACFAPIASSWRARRQRVSSEQRRELGLPVPVVGPGFDWGYFQASPPDQQIDHLVGDEWLTLDGVEGARGRVQSSLPGVEGVAWVMVDGAAHAGQLAMTADSLAIDADRLEARVTFRGIFGVREVGELGNIRVAGGLRLRRESLDIFDVAERLRGFPTLLATATESVRQALEGSARERQAESAGGVGGESEGRTDNELGPMSHDFGQTMTLRSRLATGGSEAGRQGLESVRPGGPARGGAAPPDGAHPHERTLPSAGVTADDTAQHPALGELGEDTLTLDSVRFPAGVDADE
ncbi:MAG: DUF2169 domain-containing protein [Deltaproteobacteria bacterium]|nr:DUF2169 domain-containing protein [Deltaproteobacteria bacterium]